MSLFPKEFYERAHQAIRVLKSTDLPEIASREVDEFFAKYSDLKRDQLTEAFITSLVLEKLSTAAEGAAQPDKKSAA